MVENSNHCVLEWAGHAGYIAERFSGLLARQAFVDVTLICEEQKLRVHKLVLASNSTYFEEILQQDLGQDPIILLRDLNFEVLKAMVEFMYCGETTISHEHLPSLLTASRIFKVKELAYIIDTIMEAQNYSDAIESVVELHSFDDDSNLENNNNKNNNKNNNNNNNNKINARNDTIGKNPNIDNNSFKHTLYEDSYDNESNNLQQSFKDYLSTEDIKEKIEDESLGASSLCEKSKKIMEESRMKIMNGVKKIDDISDNVKETIVEPLLYEQCCDVIDLNIPERYSSRAMEEIKSEEKVAQNFVDGTNDDKSGKVIKVYTHKRRKPANNNTKNELTDLNDFVSKLSPTNSIDLTDTPSSNSIPVTLLTPLDMECAEYLFSLDNENMQSVGEGVVGSMNEQQQQRSLTIRKDIDERLLNVNKNDTDKKVNVDVKAMNDDNKVREMEKPVLRRSVRLNQQECCEDVTNNGVSPMQQTLMIADKLVEKANFSNKMESSSHVKGNKRRIKENNRKVTTDQNVINVARCNKKCFNDNLRAQRNNSKTVVKRSINNKTDQRSSKGGGGNNNNNNNNNNRLKCEMTTDEIDDIDIDDIEDIERLKISMGSSQLRRNNTVGYISRALWGDMSDIIERKNDIMDLTDYSPDGEIPFAVGLLPLRTALEKMQAMTDYQPRKTRSSSSSFVAPFKQDTNNLKRKTTTNPSSFDSNVLAKRQNVGSGSSIVQDNKTNTVCHIQIRAAPSSHYIKNRKKFLTEHVTTTLGSPTIVNRQ